MLIKDCIEFTYQDAALRTLDPLSMLQALLERYPALAPHRQTLFLVLSELCTNALEHGILRLDSSLKATPDGFSTYYRRRDEKLTESVQGNIHVQISLNFEEKFVKINILVTDSGPGYTPDPKELLGPQYSGRGLLLVEKIAEKLSIYEPGNRIEVLLKLAVE